jgi:hypothetical protein
MKILLIGFLAMGSISVFASEQKPYDSCVLSSYSGDKIITLAGRGQYYNYILTGVNAKGGYVVDLARDSVFVPNKTAYSESNIQKRLRVKKSLEDKADQLCNDFTVTANH